MWTTDRAHLNGTETASESASSARSPGKRTLTMSLPAPVQRKVAVGGDASADTIESAAARGIATPSDALPHRDTVQAAFGRHRIDHVQAHTGREAAASADDMHAEAYAVGDHIVLGGGMPTLHTVAHEAAHIVQQRAGVARKGGGNMDAFERHADAVADAVVSGGSAEALLDEVAGDAAAPAPTVQRIVKIGDVVLDVVPEHKGPQAAQVRKMHDSQKSIYTFKTPKHLVDYMAGTAKRGPEVEDNPDYAGDDEALAGAKQKKRKGAADDADDRGGKKGRGEDDDEVEAEPLFSRDYTLQTNYMRLSIRGNAARSLERNFEVTTFAPQQDRRPPVEALDGRQGQHKVAWRAIWGALDRCRTKTLAQAHAIMDEIIGIGAAGGIADEKPQVFVVGGDRPRPPTAETLILKGHNYLVARQNDDPAWESEDKAQLKGKGERGLKESLATWQGYDAGTSRATIQAFFAAGRMNKLFDVTGREGDEVDDAVARARRELHLHNPAAFGAHSDVVDAWLATQRPGDVAGDEEAEAAS